MPVVVPFGNTVDSVISVNLEGDTYDLRYRWNNLSECWYLYLGFSGAEPLLKTKLLVGFDILAPFKAKEGVPNGTLYLIDTLKRYGRPSKEDIGVDKRFKIVYTSSREILQ